MACVCAPPICTEMDAWVRLGGGNSGCCGNAAHTFGFHLPANALPASDYSRREDPAGPDAPVNWDWACAGDFFHGGIEQLRTYHRTLLSRLMNNDPRLSMICEFIGKPWPTKGVYYWARWDGVATLQRYTGSGHDTWSHISWYRSRANQLPDLWCTDPGPAPAPAPAPPTPTTGPVYPGYLMTQNPNHFDANVRTWQCRMRERGWSLGADGYFGPATLSVVRQFQAEKALGVDGIIGPKTWAAAWQSPVT